MADTVVVVGDEEPNPQPEPEPVDPADVVVAVADAMNTGAAIGAASQPEPSTREPADARIDQLVTELAGLSASVAALVAAQQRTDEHVAEIETVATTEPEIEIETDEDEIEPARHHPWFRSLDEIRGVA